MNLLTFIKNPLKGSDLLDIVNSSIVDREKDIVEIQEEQWDDGKDNQGNIIGRYKRLTDEIASNSISIAIGSAPNTPKIAGEPYNLNWSGDLRKQTYLKTKKESNDISISVNSKSTVVSELYKTIKKSGLISDPKTIFGIQQNENLGEVTKIVNKDVLIKLKRKYV